MTDTEIEAVFIELVKDGELDRIVSRLTAAYFSQVSREDVIQYVQDAVEACLRRMRDGTSIKRPGAFIHQAARNLLNKSLERDPDPEALATYVRFISGVSWDDPAAEQRRQRALTWVEEAIATWPSSNMQRTMRLLIEAAKAQEQMTDLELAERLGCPVGTASSWKSRAKDRLQERLLEQGMSWDDFAQRDDTEAEDSPDAEGEDDLDADEEEGDEE